MTAELDDILYPPIEPYETGELIVGDGHRVYWEQSGNPEGKPVVFLHGGPGAGTSPWHRRFFDPERYRIVLLDQRGTGRSTPHASEPKAVMLHNTTWHLVADMELLRRNLAIRRWQVFGGSWGSALALAYAEAHPERVTELVLRGIFTLRRHELEWFYEGGASVIFPDLWEDFIAPIPVLERSRLIEAYHRRLSDPDPAVHVPAAVAWSRWEAATLTLLPDTDLVRGMTKPAAATAFARIENHFFLHGGWFTENQLIDGVDAIRDIPAVIVQGRYDVCTPIMTAWDLHRAWPEAEFIVISDASHSATEPGIARALVAATDRFAAPPAGDLDAEGPGIGEERPAAAELEEHADDSTQPVKKLRKKARVVEDPHDEEPLVEEPGDAGRAAVEPAEDTADL
jgi:proline iminopeptidase